jgi:U3 small nucleolar RNA-associated protein 20
MLDKIVANFPPRFLHKYCKYIFTYLWIAMSADASVRCQEKAALVLKAQFAKLAYEKRDYVFGGMQSALQKEDDPLLRIASVRLIGVLADAGNAAWFKRKLPIVLPLFENCLVRVMTLETVSAEDSLFVKNLLFAVLKLMQLFPDLQRNSEQSNLLNPILAQLHDCLTWPQDAVRLAATHVVTCLLSGYKSYELGEALRSESPIDAESGSDVSDAVPVALGVGAAGGSSSGGMHIVSSEYLLVDTKTKIAELCEASVELLKTNDNNKELFHLVIRNLVFMAKALAYSQERSDTIGPCSPTTNSEIVSSASVPQPSRLNEDQPAKPVSHGASGTTASGSGRSACHVSVVHRRDIDLDWLARQMVQVARFEVSRHPSETFRRTAVIMWIGSMSRSSKGCVEKLLPTVLPVVHRGMNTTVADEALKNLATEISAILREVVGVDVYMNASLRIHQTTARNLEDRRRQRAAEIMMEPEKAANRRLRKQQRKTMARKRRAMEEAVLGTRAKKPKTG